MPGSSVQHLPEFTILVVEVKKISFIIIIGDIDIRPAVAVDVADGNTKPKIQAAAMDPRLLADIGEMAIFILVEPVSKPGMPGISKFVGIEKRIVEHIGMIDHEYIQVTIVVHIKKAGHGS